MRTIGDRLREERNKTGLSQDKFAEFCGIKKLTQFNYESGKSSPSADYLVKITEIGADVNYILTGVHALGFKAQSTIEFQPSATFEVGVANESEGGGANDERFSEEDLQILRMIKRLPPNKKSDEIEDIKIFLQSFEEDVRYWVAMNQGGDVQQAA